MMQLVLTQTVADDFEIPGDHPLVTLAVSGSILMKCDLKCKLISDQ